MLLDYIACYDSQDMGFKGPNLAKKQHRQLRARAPEVSRFVLEVAV
jgi:hypothetical protein